MVPLHIWRLGKQPHLYLSTPSLQVEELQTCSRYAGELEDVREISSPLLQSLLCVYATKPDESRKSELTPMRH
jgi:hypothetical protein